MNCPSNQSHVIWKDCLKGKSLYSLRSELTPHGSLQMVTPFNWLQVNYKQLNKTKSSYLHNLNKCLQPRWSVIMNKMYFLSYGFKFHWTVPVFARKYRQKHLCIISEFIKHAKMTWHLLIEHCLYCLESCIIP